MTLENHEQRIKKLENSNRKLILFCVRLIGLIHQLDKNMANNLGGLANAIKTPDNFDLEDYLKQIARAEFKFDQMDAHLGELGVDHPSPPEN